MPSVRSFVLPDLGEGLTEAQVIRWLVQVGDVVAVDQPTVEVETAKTNVEVPAPFAGVVSALCAEEGAMVSVGQPLITIAVEEAPGTPGGAPADVRPAARASRRAADPLGHGLAPRAVTSPVVRSMAQQHGVNLLDLPGSGPDGLITRADVASAITRERADRAAATPARTALGPVADRFVRSRREIPDATCWVDADATALVRLSRELGDAIGLTALLAKICVVALNRHPQLNASVDVTRSEAVRWPGVNLSVATHTARGLVVPVIRDADKMTTERLGAEVRRVVMAAREGGLQPSDLSGGTFTLNNYGVLGVDGSTPILNYPEGAMLGVGRISEKPWAHRGKLSIRKVVQLSLTFDHRICEGADAGDFLRYVSDCVERPLRLLREL